MQNVKNKTKELDKIKLVEAEDRLVVGEHRMFGRWGKWVKGIKRRKLPAVK